MNCIVCNKSFHATRSDAKTCSAACRAKLRRMKKKALTSANENTIGMTTYAELQTIRQSWPDAYEALMRLYSIHGKDALNHALDAIDEICNPG